MNYTPYEAEVLREIGEWEESKPGIIAMAVDAVGTPISMMIDKAPGSVIHVTGRAVLGFMEMLRDISYWTYSEKDLIKEAGKAGIRINAISELAGQDLLLLDRIARRYFSSNKLIAALEGAGCGLGGLALIAADIPALFAIAFRSIQQIGASYGFDMKDPDMLPIIMSVFHAGSGISVAAKSSLLADMSRAAPVLAGKAVYGKIAGRTKTALIVDMFQQYLRNLPAHLAENLSKRKLGQAIPVIGAVVSAGFNYWFMSNVVLSAYMIFRKLHIERKYAATPDRQRTPSLFRIIKSRFITDNF
ncbi:MAG: EcsC family protein [Spirochaetes bacterium]|nr:EcsC family protein [Spirochaetota bacterium]